MCHAHILVCHLATQCRLSFWLCFAHNANLKAFIDCSAAGYWLSMNFALEIHMVLINPLTNQSVNQPINQTPMQPSHPVSQKPVTQRTSSMTCQCMPRYSLFYTQAAFCIVCFRVSVSKRGILRLPGTPHCSALLSSSFAHRVCLPGFPLAWGGCRLSFPCDWLGMGWGGGGGSPV